MLKIRNTNTAQRGGLFFTIAACLLLILAHSPTSGYITHLPHQEAFWDDNPLFPKEEYRYYGNISHECYSAFLLSKKRYAYNTILPRELQERWAREAREDQKAGEEGLSKYNCYGLWVAPFSKWRTEAPMIPWIGNVVNLLSTIFIGLLLGAVWMFAFRTIQPEDVRE